MKREELVNADYERIEKFIDGEFESVGQPRTGYIELLGADELETIIREAISFGKELGKQKAD